MQTKFDVGDFLLLDNGYVRQIEKIIVDEYGIHYASKGLNFIAKESELTPEYILKIEEFLKKGQATLQIMKKKLNQN